MRSVVYVRGGGCGSITLIVEELLPRTRWSFKLNDLNVCHCQTPQSLFALHYSRSSSLLVLDKRISTVDFASQVNTPAIVTADHPTRILHSTKRP
jgi:hypothetical protein